MFNKQITQSKLEESKYMEIKDKDMEIEEVSKVLGIKKKSLIHMVDRGDLPGESKSNGKLFISKDEVNDFLKILENSHKIYSPHRATINLQLTLCSFTS